ncbi:MAG TPA: TRAP transporter small permease subunit, partial [Thiothrix sp.]|nr:TRAP transporter small permease subunit [Thiothrix sp.]
KIIAIIEAINEWAGRFAAWSIFLMVIITFLVVVFRYGIQGLYSIAFQESAMYFHAFAFLLGASYTLKHNDHVRVDIFYQNFSEKQKAYVDLLGTTVFLIPFCLFILWVSADYVAASWQSLEGSRETGGLPFVFILKTTIPIFAILLLLQGVAQILRAVLQLTTTPSTTSSQSSL